MQHPTLLRRFLITAAGLLCSTVAVQAQTKPLDQTFVPVQYDSGLAANLGSGPEVVISFPVYSESSSWMRLYFDEVLLSGDPADGTGSILRITSLLDGAQQRMTAKHVAQWENTSAYFNGDAVLVEVLAFPGTGQNRVDMQSIAVGEPTVSESQCGSQDDRQPSSDPRSGRLNQIGCTGWIINDAANCSLTAGHCGPGNNEVLMFNVPASNSNGSTNNPGPEDQYAVDPSSIQTNGGQGIGNDYAYFGVFPNSNTGLTPFEAQGSEFVISNPPAFQNGQQIRITGFGVDFNDNTRNQTQQTHVGPRVNTSLSTEVEYQTDTEGGNSGSPVILESTGDAIGIHTHGGCGSSTGNHGTGINSGGLQNFLGNPQGVCSLFPNARFNGVPTSGDSPLLVTFTNLSTGDPTSYVWDFGDGTSSTSENPTHTYTAPGTYDVTLTATSDLGSDVEVLGDYIVVTAPPVGDATCVPYNGSSTNPNVFSCTTDPIIGTNWTASIDGNPVGATSGLVFVFGYSQPLSPGLPLSQGELLIDVSTPFQLLNTSFLIGGTATVSEAVPNDPSLVLLTIYVQGFFNNVGGSGLLTNGIELTFGTF